MGITLLVLVGMVTHLFYITQPMPRFYTEPYFLDVVQSLSSLYSSYIQLESHAITFILNNINLFSEEQLRNVYLILQELINIGERVNYLLQHWIDILGVDFAERDVLIDISVEFRSEGNTLMGLLRNIEDRLNIPQNERMPLNDAFEV